MAADKFPPVKPPSIPMPAVVEKRFTGRVAPKAYAAARYSWAYLFCPHCGHSRLVHNQMPKGRPWLSIQEVMGRHKGHPHGWGECHGEVTWCYACRLQAEQRESGSNAGDRLPDRKSPATRPNATARKVSGRDGGANDLA